MVYVVLVLVLPTSPPINFILAQTFMLGFLGHLRAIEQNPMWHHLILGIIQLVLLVVLRLLLVMLMVKVVLILVPSTFPTKMLIVRLMVVILCHLIVGILHT